MNLILITGLPGKAAAAAASRSATASTSATSAKDPQHTEAQRLPGFQGRTLDGKTLSTASFSGKRLLLLCFNPGIAQSAAYAQALANLAPERSRNNFEIAGVAMGLDPADARAFAAKLKLDFPIFDDSDATIAGGLGLQAPVVLLGVDAEGRVGMAMLGFEHEQEIPAVAVEDHVREFLRLPRADTVTGGALDPRPKAPPFDAERLSGGDRFRLSDLSGKPVALVFFMPTCPHCRDALRFFKGELARMPEKNRPVLVGVSMDSRAYSVESTLAEEKLDFFPVLLDADRRIASAYGSFAGVPDIVLIDATGRIAFRSKGWSEEPDARLMRMRLARLAGAEVPMLLDSHGFSGNDTCAICHTMEAAAWKYTEHSVAFDTLVTRGADHDPKCVGCHVVGFGQAGGYSEAARQQNLENVGCETCHGKGGGHLDARSKTAGGAAAVDYRSACKGCHDPQHSLGFEYEKFLPKVSHAAIAALSDAEREKLIAGRNRPRDLLPTGSAVVGSSACKTCHEHEYFLWSTTAHARSVESLRKERKESKAECLRCHVTAYGRPGGFPDGEPVRAHEDLARVGCESCHGAGAEHVKSGGKQLAGIVTLGDKCDSCVILQICGGCHDDANDPDFRFNVTRKIDLQHHGRAPAVPERSVDTTRDTSSAATSAGN
ncbi:MAG TPA: multiheme c-type cytochrome [Candidatus Limnocylindrales bacterium]|nr:multiheme c-type cytochrome [Candidatus Limnocylindrales bacterium]